MRVAHKVRDHYLHHERQWQAAMTTHWVHQLPTVGVDTHIIIFPKIWANHYTQSVSLSTRTKAKDIHLLALKNRLTWVQAEVCMTSSVKFVWLECCHRPETSCTSTSISSIGSESSGTIAILQTRLELSGLGISASLCAIQLIESTSAASSFRSSHRLLLPADAKTPA